MNTHNNQPTGYFRVACACAGNCFRPVWGPKPYPYIKSHRDQWKSSLSSMDSDLEAFSLNPAHDSVGALPFQATP